MRNVPLLACLLVASAPAAPAAAQSDIVIYASDIQTVRGNWTRHADAGAAGGGYLGSADLGWSTTTAPLASPADYLEVSFDAPGGTPYHLWLRLRATANNKYNDSVWVQYSDAVHNGAPAFAIGSTSALLVNLENCSGCGHSGWGWKDGAYWLTQAATVRFAAAGSHTIRVQVREDGVQIDQIVLSPATYLTAAPGATTNDTTIAPTSGAPKPPPPSSTSTPYLGSPAPVPGTIRSEHFDNGGAGIAYADSSPGNAGGAFRTGDVDIESSSSGYNVGWVDAGEWLHYTVEVASAGSYTIGFRVASLGRGGTFHLEMGGADVTGALQIPDTGGWQAWQTVTKTVSLSAGRQVARLVMDARGANAVGNFGPIAFAAAQQPPPSPPPGPPGPYSGSPAPLPGRIEAVDFDHGGAGVAYSDTTPGNSGGAYRSTDVDIEPSAGGGFNVGWTAAGEWLTYTVRMATAGQYSIQLRVAAPGSGNSVGVTMSAGNVAASVPVPATGGWQSWTTVRLPATLAAGDQQLTVRFETGGINLGPITVASTPPPGTQPQLRIWLTSRDGALKLAERPPVTFASGSGSASLPTVTVDENVRYQQIEGFGGSITDSSAFVLSSLPADRRTGILRALFDRTAGIGLNFLRQPIGSSDFARNWYTFDDIDPSSTDYGLAQFSIDHDRAYILPMLRAALAVNPSIKVMASPWSPPAWMKTSRTIPDGGSLRPEAYGTYADYFVRFVQAYQAEGVPIDSLTVQNEPQTAPPYPSMLMSAGEQATFIGRHLGPALGRAGLRPRIFAWDHNWETAFPLAVMADATAAPYVSGVAFHCYGGGPGAMSSVRDAHPRLDIALTECADGSRAGFGDKLTHDIRTLLIGSLRNWARTVAKWNLVLDETTGPRVASTSCRNCIGFVTVHSATGAVTYNADYYSIGHASRFIQRGAYRIESNTFGFGGIENVAFQNPDGSLVVLAINAGYGPVRFQIRSRASHVEYTLPAETVATFTWMPQ